MAGVGCIAGERPSWTARMVEQAVLELNRLRRSSDPAARVAADRLAEVLFDASRHLIAYGSLAPGGGHAAELEGLQGRWQPGWVTGTLAESGWGAALGYPALHWVADAEKRVPAQLFTSPDLPRHWTRLDRFEGDEYRRILAPIFDANGLLGVGNLYEIAPNPAAGD
ncbi:MAG: gamma-glutamylcyclotransferase [Gemmatimonadales bacterium]|jgi:gamma-glutamylcyclotransferase (GGCT)/AIG2-like uncharacterized protein YtfP|nr:gamma-glutamylcyclotransferase [Gemmatimonadales bacterium]